MENFFSRYKNPMVLMVVLLIQVVALATQVRRPENARSAGGMRLIRVWTMTAITPFERALVATGHFFRNTWHNYIDLHGVRKENRELQEEVARLRLEQVRLKADAAESQRLRALLDFKERYVGQTVAAEVIGSSGSDLSHMIQIDKGSRAGVKPDMPVITPDGIVGKVKEVFPLSSQVLVINDHESGAGVLLQNSRLHGILRGVGQGDLQVSDVMSDEKVDIGEQVVTSGGDGIYPKGFPVGTVTKVSGDLDGGPFLAVKIKPAANLERLEEVLIVTKVAEEAPVAAGEATPRRAAEILAERLPSVAKATDSGGVKTPATAGVNAVPHPVAPTTGATGTPASHPVTPTAGATGTPGPAPTSSAADKTSAAGSVKSAPHPVTPTAGATGTPAPAGTSSAAGKTPAAGGVNAVPGATSGAGGKTSATGSVNAAPSPTPTAGAPPATSSATAKTNKPGAPSAAPKRNLKTSEAAGNATGPTAPVGKPKMPVKPSPGPTPEDNTQNPQPDEKKSQQPPVADPEKPPR